MRQTTPDIGVPLFLSDYFVDPSGLCNPAEQHTIESVTATAARYALDAMPYYHRRTQNPHMAINPSIRSGNCLARATLLHSLITPCFEDISSAIVIQVSPEGQGHAFNVVVEREGIKGILINNDIDVRRDDEGRDIEYGSIWRRTTEFHEDAKHIQQDTKNTVLQQAYDMRKQDQGVMLLRCNSIKSVGHYRTAETVNLTENRCTEKVAILIGQTATSYVNALTGHIPLRHSKHRDEIKNALKFVDL